MDGSSQWRFFFKYIFGSQVLNVSSTKHFPTCEIVKDLDVLQRRTLVSKDDFISVKMFNYEENKFFSCTFRFYDSVHRNL